MLWNGAVKWVFFHFDVCPCVGGDGLGIYCYLSSYCMCCVAQDLSILCHVRRETNQGLSSLYFKGHSHIDLIRIDIEGWEFDTLRALIEDFRPSAAEGSTSPEDDVVDDDNNNNNNNNGDDDDEVLPFGQLLIEVHLWQKRFQDFLGWWEMLEAAGLRPFMSEVRRDASVFG